MASSSAMLQVFGQPASTDVARVMACLLERQLDFELVRTDTFKRGQKLPNFVKLKDLSGQQVTLTHGDVTLCGTIPWTYAGTYVCTEFPRWCTRDLYGAGALERASVEQWLQAEAQSFDAPAFRLALAPPHEAAAAESERQLARVLDVYDGALGRSAYLAGDDFTLADLAHLPGAHYLAACSARGRALLASRGNVARWYAAISSRPAWRQVVAAQARTAHGPVVAVDASAAGRCVYVDDNVVSVFGENYIIN